MTEYNAEIRHNNYCDGMHEAYPCNVNGLPRHMQRSSVDIRVDPFFLAVRVAHKLREEGLLTDKEFTEAIGQELHAAEVRAENEKWGPGE